jgi:hypothetical protein
MQSTLKKSPHDNIPSTPDGAVSPSASMGPELQGHQGLAFTATLAARSPSRFNHVGEVHQMCLWVEDGSDRCPVQSRRVRGNTKRLRACSTAQVGSQLNLAVHGVSF